ncbi:uncharacterized protein BDCG_16752 [Blastomyces dermatitidis ER-3]|uniref:Uncharacterized protein n=3 Tax=Blastomyces TaxID=229219 RepID=A0A179UD49_BLAGS|nr:uncharacterized protein BDBG_16489 [Blastomyces gilchristii SLH14081]XP_045280457.1 uncharacterized protein BDCG_16752 [Blastomyces dermatitidis ER-3]EGE77490.2 hypothetical protein BDDG_00427 [Blastomyces dermatitidis ATCC 18188]OAT00730.1 hypothetical protein BDCG_16752 [Blastomyces dermatitidis ER-3]OAT05760.1 hypothetical protein BDBG_16489 [Blastomyces gilchristii SLH14081]
MMDHLHGTYGYEPGTRLFLMGMYCTIKLASSIYLAPSMIWSTLDAKRDRPQAPQQCRPGCGH